MPVLVCATEGHVNGVDTNFLPTIITRMGGHILIALKNNVTFLLFLKRTGVAGVVLQMYLWVSG